ncbi:MAG: glycosyltransferase family A protein [Saprospiraceae bacterium]
MINNPLVSILLPTHNRADVLPFAIHSVLAQTIQNFELLIVGDGCTDDTAQVVLSFVDPRIHWFNLPKAPNFGYANRNIALKKAHGEFIAFMAHDDLWFSDHLEQLLPNFDNKKIDIVYSRPLWVIPLGMIVPGLFNLNHVPTRKLFLDQNVNKIPASCVMHRQDCFSKYGYWNDQLAEAGDIDMWTRIIKGGEENNFTYLGTPTCLHFKAVWHKTNYDEAFGFYFWKHRFDLNLMPANLKIEVLNGENEQQAIWEKASSDPQDWNKKIRLAIEEVIDLCAWQSTQDDVKESLIISENNRRHLQNKLANMENSLADTQTALMNIQNTLTWRMHEYIFRFGFAGKFYRTVVKPIKGWLSSHTLL